MNLREINEIIHQIAETLECPRCNVRILPKNIHVAEIQDNGDYLFDVDCHRCEAEMSLSAHVERVAEESREATSHALKDDRPPITTEEVRAMKKALQNFCGSFIETFK